MIDYNNFKNYLQELYFSTKFESPEFSEVALAKLSPKRYLAKLYNLLIALHLSSTVKSIV